MDILFECIGEALLEVYMGLFLSLLDSFLPHKLTRKGKNILTVVVAILAMALACGSLIGIVLLLESGGKSVLGWHLVGLAVVYLTFGIFLMLRKRRRSPKPGPEL